MRGTGRRWFRACAASALAVGLCTAGGLAGAARDPARTAPAVPLLLARAGSFGEVFVLTSSCPSPTCLHLEHTNDLGAIETPATLPPVGGSGREGSIGQVTFASLRDGVVLELNASGRLTTLYATTDGAATWTRAPLAAGTVVFSLTATPTYYFAVVARCANASLESCTSFRLARSRIGRVAWTYHPLANQAGLATYGAQVAAVGTRVWISEGTTADEPELATSTNEGTTFDLTPAPLLAAVTACSLDVTTTTSMWAVCRTGMLVAFLHSVDGGATWHELGTPLVAGTGGYGFDPVEGDVAFLAKGLLPDGLYRLSGTESVAQVGSLPSPEAPALVFTNGNDGLAVGAGTSGDGQRLLRTLNGGRAWHAVG